jgi:hypothetical protein
MQMTTTPATDISCPEQPKSDQQIVRAGLEAWSRLKKCKTWDDWLVLGEGLLVGRTEAMRTSHSNKPEGRRYNCEFSLWLESNKLDDGTSFGEIDKAVRARLFECLAHRDEIEKWRKTLPISERLKLNHPAVVLRRWKKTRVAKPDDNAKPKQSRMAKLEAAVIALDEENHRLKRDAKDNAYFTPQDRPIDIANYIWRTIHEAPKLAHSIASALNKIAREAEQTPTSAESSDEGKVIAQEAAP